MYMSSWMKSRGEVDGARSFGKPSFERATWQNNAVGLDLRDRGARFGRIDEHITHGSGSTKFATYRHRLAG